MAIGVVSILGKWFSVIFILLIIPAVETKEN